MRWNKKIIITVNTDSTLAIYYNFNFWNMTTIYYIFNPLNMRTVLTFNTDLTLTSIVSISNIHIQSLKYEEGFHF